MRAREGVVATTEMTEEQNGMVQDLPCLACVYGAALKTLRKTQSKTAYGNGKKVPRNGSSRERPASPVLPAL
jgi:hypothetical protein